MDDAFLDLLARCLEIRETSGADAAEEFCREQGEHGAELRRRLGLLADVGLLEAGVDGDEVPTNVGDFDLIGRLGGGGMGVVYRARQRSLDREVALKLVRPDQAWFDRARARFHREVEAVANLHHPGIVPIYAVGEQDGLPWFAMELIEGCSLEDVISSLRGKDPASLEGSDFARAVAAKAGTPEHSEPAWIYQGSWSDACCRIVGQVAGALEHAHRRGVLHRDIKPGNIMLTVDGRVMLVDFGVARTATQPSMTRTGTRLGTPAYMPPEQIRGDEVDERADVYSLAATFYEILTLQRAFSEVGEEQLLRQVREGAFVAPRKHVPTMSRDLDAVCRMAMDPDMRRRYDGVVDLRRDLEAVLSRRPVEARRPHPLLRLRRWTQRNPTTSVAVVLGTLLLVVGPSIYAVRLSAANDRTASALEEAREQTSRAEVNYERAVATLDRMKGIAEDLDSIPGMDGVRDDILDSVVAFHLELTQQNEDVPGQQLRVAESMEEVAIIRGFRGRLEEALEMHERAVARFARLKEEGANEGSFLRWTRAVLNRGQARFALSMYDEALADADVCIEALGRLGARSPDDPYLRDLTARVHCQRGGIHAVVGRTDRARAEFEAAVEIFEALLRINPAAGCSRELAKALVELADMGGDDAPARHRRAIEILDVLTTEKPRDHAARTALAGALDSAGRSAAMREDWESAIAWQRRAVDAVKEMAHDYPGVWTFQRNAAILRLNLGVSFGMMNRDAEGLEQVAMARSALEELLTRRPEDHGLRVQVAACLVESARLRRTADDHDGALDDLERAREAIEAALATRPDHVRWRRLYGAVLLNLGDAYVFDRDHDKAFELTGHFLETFRRAFDYYSALRLTGSCTQLLMEDRELDEEEREELMAEYLDVAFERMEQAIALGFEDVAALDGNPRLTVVRRDPRYAELSAPLRKDVTPAPR